MIENKDILSLTEAANFCSVSRVTLWRWIKTGELKAYQTPGGLFKIRKEDLIIFIKEKLNYLPIPIDKKRILIVDDDPIILDIISDILDRYNYTTRVASNGYEAGIESAEFKPALIILDLFMPNIDGFEVCKKIKSNNKSSHIKILVITGYDSEENKTRALNCGADGYLPKPIKKDSLIYQVKTLLEQI